MRILIISDLHGNRAALEAVASTTAHERIDAVVCLGDLVSYGPDPGYCVDYTKDRAIVAVRGNHDHAVAYKAEPRCAPAYEPLASATLKHALTVLSDTQRAFLAGLPLQDTFVASGARFTCVHAAPSNPLYRYLSPSLPEAIFEQEASLVSCDFLLVGHTHRPLCKTFHGVTILNPGSVGQPSDGDPRASFAIWDDGQVDFRRVEYPVEETIAALENLEFGERVAGPLSEILRTGKSLGR